MADSVLSFVIPAHDEADSIVATVEAIQVAAAGRGFEVIVVDDASNDATAALARAAGARVVATDVRQIAAARNAGAAAATGDVLVFVDADTRINRDVVDGVVRAIDGGAVGGGARVAFDRPLPLWAHVLLPLMTAGYFLLRLAAGCFVFVRRDAFDAIGGFDTELFAGEEVELSRALHRHARRQRASDRRARFVVVRARVLTSARKLRQHSGWRLLGELLRLTLLGRRGVRRRDNLSLWYGPRRTDPGSSRSGG